MYTVQVKVSTFVMYGIYYTPETATIFFDKT